MDTQEYFLYQKLNFFRILHFIFLKLILNPSLRLWFRRFPLKAQCFYTSNNPESPKTAMGGGGCIQSIYKFGFSVCLSVWVSVCLSPINFKTAELIGPKFFVRHHVTTGKIYE